MIICGAQAQSASTRSSGSTVPAVSRVRAYRIRTQVTLYEAANWLGMPPSFLSAMETGRLYERFPDFFPPNLNFTMPDRPRLAISEEGARELRQMLAAGSTEQSGSDGGALW